MSYRCTEAYVLGLGSVKCKKCSLFVCDFKKRKRKENQKPGPNVSVGGIDYRYSIIVHI